MYFTDEWAAARTGKHRTTIARWRQSGDWPPELLKLAALELDGELGLIHPAWTDWRLDRRTGELGVVASRLAFRPGQLLAIPLRAQVESALRRQIERSSVRLDHRASGRRVRFADAAGFTCQHCGASDRRREHREDAFRRLRRAR